MKKVEMNFNLPDGRLNPEKVFQFVLEKTRSMTPEEISAILKAPTKFQALAIAAEEANRIAKPTRAASVAASTTKAETKPKKLVKATEATKPAKKAAATALSQQAKKTKKPVSG